MALSATSVCRMRLLRLSDWVGVPSPGVRGFGVLPAGRHLFEVRPVGDPDSRLACVMPTLCALPSLIVTAQSVLRPPFGVRHQKKHVYRHDTHTFMSRLLFNKWRPPEEGRGEFSGGLVQRIVSLPPRQGTLIGDEDARFGSG